MNTANKITMIRVVLVPIFMVLFMIDNVMCHYAALGVFVLASITDAIDGHVARKYNQVTTFGKFVDPLADKVLTTAAFLILMYYDRMSVWALMIVLVREFAVAGIRLVAAGEGKVVAASGANLKPLRKWLQLSLQCFYFRFKIHSWVYTLN